MSNNFPQLSPPLSPLPPPRLRRFSAVSTTNSFQSDLQLQEASSCSFAPIAPGAVTLVNLPPLPPKDEAAQLLPKVYSHAFLLNGKLKPLSSPLETDGDAYVVEPVRAMGERTLYKITGDPDTVSDSMYLYDAILDEFVLSTEPRRFPTTCKRPVRNRERVGRLPVVSFPPRKGPNNQPNRAALNKSSQRSSSSWLHIDVRKPIPVVEKSLPPAISSRFTEGSLSPSTLGASGLAEASTPHQPNSSRTIFAANNLYDSPIQQLLPPASSRVIELLLATGYSPAQSRTIRIEVPIDNPLFTDSELFGLLRQEQNKLSGFFRTYFSLRGTRSLRLVGAPGSPRDHFSLISQRELLVCYRQPAHLGRSWTDWLTKFTTDEPLTLEFVEGWLPRRVFLATTIPLVITCLGACIWILYGPERVFFSAFLFGGLLLFVQSVLVGLLSILSLIT